MISIVVSISATLVVVSVLAQKFADGLRSHPKKARCLALIAPGDFHGAEDELFAGTAQKMLHGESRRRFWQCVKRIGMANRFGNQKVIGV